MGDAQATKHTLLLPPINLHPSIPRLSLGSVMLKIMGLLTNRNEPGCWRLKTAEPV